MIEWKLVKDEMPPLNKTILIGLIEYYGSANRFQCFKARVYRPFDKDQEFNPNLYKWHEIGVSETAVLRPHIFWAEINFPEPEHEILKGRPWYKDE